MGLALCVLLLLSLCQGDFWRQERCIGLARHLLRRGGLSTTKSGLRVLRHRRHGFRKVYRCSSRHRRHLAGITDASPLRGTCCRWLGRFRIKQRRVPVRLGGRRRSGGHGGTIGHDGRPKKRRACLWLRTCCGSCVGARRSWSTHGFASHGFSLDMDRRLRRRRRLVVGNDSVYVPSSAVRHCVCVGFWAVWWLGVCYFRLYSLNIRLLHV